MSPGTTTFRPRKICFSVPIVPLLCLFIGTIPLYSQVESQTTAPVSGNGEANCSSGRPALRGSFLQPDLGDAWTIRQWQKEFSYMRRAGLDQMVIQWTADSKYKTTIYPSGLPGYAQNTNHDVVERALKAGDDNGAQIYLGLQNNDDWWIHYASKKKWLMNEATIANALADDLWKKYRHHRSLAGWYLVFELDNWNEATQTDWDNLVSFFQVTGDHLHQMTPGKPVMIAPFFNPSGGLTSSQWAASLQYILSGGSLDIVALQDGVGVGHATARQLPEWFSAVRDAVHQARPRMQFWVDSETFNGDGEPMVLHKLVNDMRAVQPYVSSYLSFSFNHYMSPQQVNPLYYRTYLHYLRTSKVESDPPTQPASLSAAALDSMTISLSWMASTDNVGVAGYAIWRNGKRVATSYDNATGFVDSGLEPNTTYTYQIAAFDAAGNKSQLSVPATATTVSSDPYLTDLALGMPYTASMPADANYPDTGGTELTDGIYGRIDYTDPAWQGRNTGSVYSFTVDLGGVQSIKEFRSRWLQAESAAILLPKQVAYSVSNDNANFTLVGTVNKPALGDEDLPAWYTLTNLGNISGRYVKLDITPPSEVWTFIDEAEVRQ